MPDDPIYHVVPNIHEPGPRITTYPMSEQGVPIRGGERLSVHSVYDGELPHTRVMAIMHLYVAPAKRPVPACAPLPGDVETLHWSQPYRTEIPRVFVPLTIRDATGHAKVVDDLPGPVYRPRGAATVDVRGFRFNHPKVEIARGQTVRWRFGDGTIHDVTLANGPRGFGSQYYTRGNSWQRRFSVPGTYQIFCSLHPVDMHQVVVVR
jgi:plastocyanin